MVVYSSDEMAQGNGISHESNDDLLDADDELIIPPFEGYDDDDVQIYDDDDDTQIYKDEDDDETQIYKDESEDDDEATDIYKENEYDDEEGNRKALHFLYRYETMVRQQEAEDEATTRHLKPLFYRLCLLGVMDEEVSKINTSNDKALIPSNEKDKQILEKIAYCEVSNLLSYKAIKTALHFLETTPSGQNELLSTDQQLMLVLRELSESYEAEYEDGNDDINNNGDFAYRQALRKRALTFPEFLHCYKTVVNGMMALQMFPKPDSLKEKYETNLASIATFEPSLTEETNTGNKAKNELSEGIMYHRSRTKERSLSMLRVFRLTKEDEPSIEPKDSPTPLSVPSIPQKKESKSDKLVDEMRKIIALKDRQIEDLTTKVRQEIISDDQSIVSTRSSKSFMSTSRHSRKAAKSSKKTFRKSDSWEEMDELHKRKLVYAIILFVAFAVLYCGALYVVHREVVPPHPNDYVSKETYIELEETLQTSLKKIIELENEQTMNLKQISKQEVTITKMELDHKFALVRLETRGEKCKTDLKSAQNEVKVLKGSQLNLTNKLKKCETKLPLLEPNKKRRKQILTILAGAAGTIIAPHFFQFLGYVGSSTKIVQLVETKGVAEYVYLWKIPWLNGFKIPFMDKFFGKLGGAMKALRSGILKLGL